MRTHMSHRTPTVQPYVCACLTTVLSAMEVRCRSRQKPNTHSEHFVCLLRQRQAATPMTRTCSHARSRCAVRKSSPPYQSPSSRLHPTLCSLPPWAARHLGEAAPTARAPSACAHQLLSLTIPPSSKICHVVLGFPSTTIRPSLKVCHQVTRAAPHP